MTQVAVLVPGIMGSELRLDGEIIWPGPLRSLLLAYDNMPALLREDLVATDVIRRFSISEQYSALIADLNLCGLSEQDDPPTLFTFAYDWRKSISITAQGLADLLDHVVRAHREAVELSLIGHSMGGLVCRYYLESGDFSARPAFARVRRLITLGTPHRGAPLALAAALGMEKRLFLSAEQVHRLANDRRYPGLYHLFPPPGEPFAWDRHRSAAYEHIDVYEPEVASALGLTPENLTVARLFHSKLATANRPPWVRYFFFVGTRQTTVTAVTLLKDGAQYSVRRTEVEDAGDGTVPSWSAGVTGVQCLPVGGEHGTLYKNDDLRRTLAVLLGKAGVLAADPGRVEVALRERVVNPDDDVHVSLTFSTNIGAIDGELLVERALVDEQGCLLEFRPTTATYPVRYTGLLAEKIGLILRAPTRPGVYRIAYRASGQTSAAGYDDLFVQQ